MKLEILSSIAHLFVFRSSISCLLDESCSGHLADNYLFILLCCVLQYTSEERGVF